MNLYTCLLCRLLIIKWVAVVFGINCASNACRKLVIVRGAAEHYYCFLPALRSAINSKYYKQTILLQIIIVQYVCVVVSSLVKRCGHEVHFTK